MRIFKHRKRQKADSGFSLLELMVAVSIVAVMVGMITPHLMGASKRATSTVCEGNTKTIQDALAEYDLLHQTLPTGDSEAQLATLVSEQLLSNDALNGNYTINDTDPNNIAVGCSNSTTS